MTRALNAILVAISLGLLAIPAPALAACTPTNGGLEICDGLDNDCNGKTDSQDGNRMLVNDRPYCEKQAGVCAGTQKALSSCTGGTWKTCSDTIYKALRPTYLNPEASTTCDGLDNDCDGVTDEGASGTFFRDADGDSYGSPADVVPACSAPAGYVADGTDCDDAQGSVHPGALEVCDGLDNDCDSVRDQGNPGGGLACDTGSPGPCAAGITVCVNNSGLECHMLQEPTNEVCGNGLDEDCDGTADNGCEFCVPTAQFDTTCDGLDDDCDGITDEELPEIATECGVGGCVAGGMLLCENGNTRDTCVPNAPMIDDDCNGVDDDCDGQTDEHYGVQPSTCGRGECVRSGQTTCSNGLLLDTCAPGQPSAEICDGKDNDCNGKTDAQDGNRMLVNDRPFCEKQAGVCQGARKPLSACVAGRWKPCGDSVYKAASASYQGTEIPGCDGKDNDCDGLVDEAWFTASTACGLGVCASSGVKACLGGTVTDTCVAKPPTGDDTDCDTLDDDCDGLVDNHFVPDTACFLPGVCAAGNHASTCVAGAVTPCFQDRPPQTNYDECNGLDDDCNGQVDEDQQVVDAVWCGVGACESFGVLECQDGRAVEVCTPGEPWSEGDYTCDGVDDDCDSDDPDHGGGTDEDYLSFAGETTCGVGACAAQSAWQCVDGVETDVCVPLAGEATDQYCNAVDDDCDGETDETPEADGDCEDGSSCTADTCAFDAEAQDAACASVFDLALPGCLPETFVDVRNGSATDATTGLRWKLDWAYMSWSDAATYCAELPTSNTAWRLPTLAELRTLVRGCPALEPTGACAVTEGACEVLDCFDSPCIVGCAAGAGPANGCYWDPLLESGSCGLPDARFWSSLLVPDSPDDAWTISGEGKLSPRYTGATGMVRCVKIPPQ